MCIKFFKLKSGNGETNENIINVFICYDDSRIIKNIKGSFLVLVVTFHNTCNCKKDIHLSFPETGEWVDCVKVPAPYVYHQEGIGYKTMPLAPQRTDSIISKNFTLPPNGKIEGHIVVKINNDNNEWRMCAKFPEQTITINIDKGKLKFDDRR